jgi:glucose/arabinose dehydrogenase
VAPDGADPFPQEATMIRLVRTSALLTAVLAAAFAAFIPPVVAVTNAPVAGATRILGGLNYPAAFTIDPNGRFFYGERHTGKIKIYDPDRKKTTLFYTVTNLVDNGEQGLLGLAIHWNYPARPWVYAYATRSENGNPYDEILKIVDNNGKGSLKKVIWKSDTRSGSYHDGGRILWEPGGSLLAVVGDAHDSGNAQDLDVWAGKVLRMKGDGTVPPDNPIPGSLVYAYGIRNSYGFDIDDETGRVWESENGPSCNDEINLILPGENYAWGPNQTCSTPPDPPANTNQDGPDRHLPIKWWGNTIAPTGVAFCFGCKIPDSEGSLFWGAYNDDAIRRGTLNGNRDDITNSVIVYTHSDHVLSLEVGPNGNVHFSDTTGIWRLTKGG